MTTTPKDGGPAFPSSDYGEFGMSLRDYFASQVLAASCENPWASHPEELPNRCYIIADAMLKAREASE